MLDTPQAWRTSFLYVALLPPLNRTQSREDPYPLAVTLGTIVLCGSICQSTSSKIRPYSSLRRYLDTAVSIINSLYFNSLTRYGHGLIRAFCMITTEHHLYVRSNYAYCHIPFDCHQKLDIFVKPIHYVSWLARHTWLKQLFRLCLPQPLLHATGSSKSGLSFSIWSEWRYGTYVNISLLRLPSVSFNT